jgi:hypothetical protein
MDVVSEGGGAGENGMSFIIYIETEKWQGNNKWREFGLHYQIMNIIDIVQPGLMQKLIL